MSSALAFDTSNYTTSCAWFDGAAGQNESAPLPVPSGGLGLRQSEALFQHVRHLPEVYSRLSPPGEIAAVGASETPREVAGSYMPCFLAGAGHGRVLAETLGVPYYGFSHQQRHIAAAAWSAGAVSLLDRPHLSWHLSGGTTELLCVEPAGPGVTCRQVGGTTDISAGQLIDRTGRALGLDFPAGRALDALAENVEEASFFAPRVDGLHFSLSGLENKVNAQVAAGCPPADIAYFALRSVIAGVQAVTERAADRYGGLPVLFSGGVAASGLMRRLLAGYIFAEPQYATDNAMGTAILTHRRLISGG